MEVANLESWMQIKFKMELDRLPCYPYTLNIPLSYDLMIYFNFWNCQI
jgi:hypothetical protein